MSGHYATRSGLKSHPEKVRAVLEMPFPSDLQSLIRFNETVQCPVKLCLPDMAPSTNDLGNISSRYGRKPMREHGLTSRLSSPKPQQCYACKTKPSSLRDTFSTGLGAVLL